MRIGRVAGVVAIVVAVVVVYLAASAPTGREAPDFSIKTATGVKKVSDLRGKVVLIDLWATWCGPCRMSIPGIQRLYEKHKDAGFEVLGIAMERDAEGAAIPAFVEEMGMTYPVGIPTSVDVMGDYARSPIPLMMLVDRGGLVTWKQEGFSEEVEKELATRVEELLGK